MKRIGLLLAILAGMSLAQTFPKKFIERYQRAHQRLEDGYWEQALKEYQGLLKDATKYGFLGETQFRIGECLFNLGRYTEAANQFELLKGSMDPRYKYLEPEIEYALGVCYLMQGNFAMAESYFGRTSLPSRAALGEGILSYRKAFIEKEKELSKEDYQEALRKLSGQKGPLALFYTARCYIGLKRSLEAMAVLNKIVKLYPHTRHEEYARYNMGEALFAVDDYAGALLKFREFLSRYPKSNLVPYASYKLACCLYEERRYGEAVDRLRRLTGHDDPNLVAHVHYIMGMCYKEEKRYSQALREFQWVRSNYPNSLLSFYGAFRLYEVYKDEGKNEEARLAASQFAQALRGFAATEELHGLGEYVSGMDRYEHKDYASALEEFKNIYQLYEDSPLREPAAAMILLCENRLGRYDDAVGWGSYYLEKYPKYEKGMGDWRARFLYNLADAYYYSGDKVQAENYYRKVKEEFFGTETQPLARASLAWMFLEQKRYEQALNEFRTLYTAGGTRSVPAIVLSLFGAGIAYYNLASKETDSAKAAEGYDSALVYFNIDKEGYEKLGLTCDLAMELVDDNLYYAGMCYSRLGYYANALEVWQKLISDYPESPKAKDGGLKLARVYFLGRKYDDAITAATWVMQHFPNTSEAEEAHILIAQSYYNNGQYDLAMKEYQNIKRATLNDSIAKLSQEGIEEVYRLKAIKAATPRDMAMVIAELRAENPNSPYLAELYYTLGDRYMEAKDYEKAVEAFTESEARADTSYLADAMLGVAEAYYNLKEWAKSADEYAKFIERFKEHPKRPAALYYEGVCYFNLGSVYYQDQNPIFRRYYKEAMKLFNEVMVKYPKSEYKKEAEKSFKKAEEMLR